MSMANKTVFALVDCNNFYASCEKLFRPDLKDKPVVVLSNNDGCVVARSKEAKALGIKMGVPLFQVRDEIEKHGITCFSSNYTLYANLSNRVMSILEGEAPQVEVYSIDEAFLNLSGVESAISLLAFGRQLKNKVDQWTGISVGVGIAPTKTLAKLANNAAKKYPATGSVVDLMDSGRQRRLLALVDVGDVWGVGRKISEKLRARGIHTALDLADANPKVIRSAFSVVLERTVLELNGVSCLEIDNIRPSKQQILCSRSFGHRITRIQDLREAIASYTTRAAEKLRDEKQLCRVVSVFIRTGHSGSGELPYSKSLSAELPYPTDDTRDLLDITEVLLQQLFRVGVRYAKGGVALMDFYGKGEVQEELFSATTAKEGSKELMAVVDSLNRRYKNSVFFASQGMKQAWSMKQNFKSPNYTTSWKDLPIVR